MAKISTEEIIAAIKRRISGESSQTAEMNLLVVPLQTIQDWIRKYETFGTDGFRSKENEKYSKSTKENAVKAYLSGDGSRADICEKFGMKDRKTLRTWIKAYNNHRELRPSSGRGSDIDMTKGRNTTYEERVEIVSHCIEHGNDYTAAIKKYGVGYQQIYSWVMKYNEKGAEGLLDKRGKGKPESQMTEQEKLGAENRMLEAQSNRLEMENAVLKKIEKIKRRWR